MPRFADLTRHADRLVHAALAAADPVRAVRTRLVRERGGVRIGRRRVRLRGRVFLIAAGKGSVGMARAAVRALGRAVDRGIVAHPHGLDPGTGWPGGIEVIAAAHPLPDAGSLRAGAAALALAHEARRDDLVLVLLSGGGSALLESLAPGVDLDDLRAVTGALQRAGADIVELNTVRRALSLLKGGRLAAAAAPARVETLLLSDVLGDRLDAIASGPTAPSSTGPAEALAVLERYGLDDDMPRLASALRAIGPVAAPAARHTLVGSNALAARAVVAEARVLGFRARVVTTFLAGEAREVGRVVGGLARAVRAHRVPVAPPCVLVLGGETTVTVRGGGRGGRNLELALGAAVVLDGLERAAVVTLGTDGVDGSSAGAGATVTGATLARARAGGWTAERAFADSDTEGFFRAAGGLRITGPTGTNVNDLAIVIVYA
jgi:hydroxypyruvate reductase